MGFAYKLVTLVVHKQRRKETHVVVFLFCYVIEGVHFKPYFDYYVAVLPLRDNFD